MADEITVVRVERTKSLDSLRVYFSEPVHLRDIGKKDHWFAELPVADELAAYQWGLEIIEKHKEREKHNA